MVSQAVPVPLAANQMAQQPIQYVLVEEQEAPDYTLALAASAAVCALAVAGVSMRNQSMRASDEAVRACELQYRRRTAAPAMQLAPVNAPMGTAQGAVARERGAPAAVDAPIL